MPLLPTPFGAAHAPGLTAVLALALGMAACGEDVRAQGIVTLMDGRYERHVFVTHEPSARVVELSLTIGGIERWMERPLHEIEAEHEAEIGAFETMLASFRWRD